MGGFIKVLGCASALLVLARWEHLFMEAPDPFQPTLTNNRTTTPSKSRTTAPAKNSTRPQVMTNETTLPKTPVNTGSSPMVAGAIVYNGTIYNGTELLDFCQDHPELPANCGWHKCAYRCNKNLGLLASPIAKQWIDGEKVPKFAEELFQKYGIPHTFNGLPSLYRFSNQDLHRLKKNRVRDGVKLDPEDKNTFPGWGEQSVALIQPIHYQDPKTTGCLKCLYNGDFPFNKTLQEIAAGTIQSKGDGFNRTTVSLNLMNNLQKLRRMMEEKPCMWKDFQILFSGDGTITNVDVDRCLQPDDPYFILDKCTETLDVLHERYLWFVDQYLDLATKRAR